MLLSDGTNSYIYGPGNIPIEQINGEGKALYLHHDQQGSTRMLTGSTGKAEATFTYDAYGNTTGTTGSATTPLGYDGQYTSADTGLIYLQARVYDPKTAQFLTRDPAVMTTREPYVYAEDSPSDYRDRSGLGWEEAFEGGSGIPCPWCAAEKGTAEALEGAYHSAKHGAEGVWNAINENEAPGDEGEAELHAKEAERASECGEKPSPGNLEKLSSGEIERILNDDSTDIHTDKENTVGKTEAGRYDYYRDKASGEIYLVPKSGGEAIPTGLGGG